MLQKSTTEARYPRKTGSTRPGWWHALPLVTSARQTAEQWRDTFTPSQRRASVAACAISVGRIGAQELALRYCDRHKVPPLKRAALLLGLSALDALDGTIARHFNATTPLGGELDPLTDKVANTLADIHRVRAGQLDSGQVAVRVARDLGVTVYRSWASWQTGGTVDTKATDAGKNNTLFRTLVGAMTDAKLASYPDALDVTESTVMSGITVIRGLHEQRKNVMHTPTLRFDFQQR